jgi:O-antigen/teichoic acid export membrane protein
LGADLTTNLEEGGKYAAAASLALILSLFTTAYNYAAEPFFFAHRDKAEAGTVYADAALAYTIVGSVMMLFILGYIDLFQLLLGRNFREGLDVVPILLVSFLFLGIYYNVSIWYKLADRTLWGAWIAGIGTVITIVLSYFLIRSMGVIGSAWTALACYLFMVFAAYFLGQKYYPIPYRIWRMLGWIGVALVFYFIMEWIRGFLEGQFMTILAINTMFIGFYVFLVFLLEKSLLRQITSRAN